MERSTTQPEDESGADAACTDDSDCPLHESSHLKILNRSPFLLVDKVCQATRMQSTICV
jgi:hypothetical protein